MSDTRVCRVCGCTDEDACVSFLGEPCHWVEEDRCSSCLDVIICRPGRKGLSTSDQRHLREFRDFLSSKSNPWQEEIDARSPDTHHPLEEI